MITRRSSSTNSIGAADRSKPMPSAAWRPVAVSPPGAESAEVAADLITTNLPPLDRMLGHVPVLVTLRAQLVTECDIYQLGAVIVNMTVFGATLSPMLLLS